VLSAERPATPAETNQHYDQPPEIFGYFLDARMKYSSGLYEEDGVGLDQAQEHKLDFIASQLRLGRESRLLDIGCGWGSLTLYAAQVRGSQVVGITPAPQQAAYVRARAQALGVADRVEVICAQIDEGAAELPSAGFDGIGMVGSIVHFRDKAETLRQAYRVLRKGGLVYLSESCFRNAAREREFAERPGTLFVRDTIFGWGELLPVSRYVAWFEDAGFSLTGLTDLTDHYARTIEDWRTNALRNRAQLEAIEPGLTDRLVHYFEASNAGWGYTTKHYALTAAKRR
jgi:cyclopropane-fatty-acyl-phospholipid synthase